MGPIKALIWSAVLNLVSPSRPDSSRINARLCTATGVPLRQVAKLIEARHNQRLVTGNLCLGALGL
jgi:hypothetical protein